MNEWASQARAALLVACLALALYLPSLGFKLVWDDPMLLQLTHERLSTGGLAGVLSSEFLLGGGASHTGYFRPVVLLSLVADEWLGGGKAWVFHLTNLLLHAFASGLVVVLLQRLLNDGPSAVFGGLLFAAHPVHVEAVAFVSGRTDLWAGCFTFLAALIWVRERGRGPQGARLSAWAGASVCLVLGMLSKELAVMVVPVWLCWDLLGGDAAPGRSTSWTQRNGGWLAAALAALAVVIALRWGALGAFIGAAASPAAMSGLPEPTATELLLPRLLTYLKLLVLPWPLSSFYTPDDMHLGPGTSIGAVLAGVLFVLADRGDARRLGAASFTWTLLFLVPVLGVVSLSTASAAERFLYIPSFGACLAAATLWGRLNRRSSVAAVVVGGAVLLLFAGATALRTPVWREQISLYTDMVRTSPGAFVAHFNLGNELAKAGRIEAAEASLARAVELAPGRAEAWNNLGSVRSRLGRDVDAERAFAEAVRLKPDFVVALRNRAWALVRAGRIDEAASAFTDLLAHEPGDLEAHKGRFDVLAERGAWSEGLQSLEAWPQASSGDRELLTRRAVALVQLGQPVQALATLEEVQGADPADAPLLIEIGTDLANARHWTEAERAFQHAIRVAPDQARAYRWLGFIYLIRNRPREAVPLLERAVALEPGDARARANLAAARKALAP